MQISAPFFYLFAGMAIVFSTLVVFKKNPVTSAFSLVAVFFAFAGIYAMLDAHLIAIMQVLVYAGAIMVLFIFVIMLLNADAPSFDFGRSHLGVRVGAGILTLALVGIFIWAFKETALPTATGGMSPAKIEELGGNTKVISTIMFSEYVLPFELTSILILAGIVGSVAIAKRKVENSEKRGAQ
jgi:NADH-quinone oxidoreductase subunit J